MAGRPGFEAAFGVSPDGTRLIASVLTIPAPAPSTGQAIQQLQPGGARSSLEEAAAVGRRGHCGPWTNPPRSSTSTFRAFLQVVGWDSVAPLAGRCATARRTEHQARAAGLRLHRPPGRDGKPGPNPGRGGLRGGLQLSDGTVVCPGPPTTQVRRAAGTVLFGAPFSQCPDDLVVPPDADFLACAAEVVGADGHTIALPATFHPTGWLDDSTLIGNLFTPSAPLYEMAYVRLGAPSKAVDLGFRGEFVGVVQPGP